MEYEEPRGRPNGDFERGPARPEPGQAVAVASMGPGTAQDHCSRATAGHAVAAVESKGGVLGREDETGEGLAMKEVHCL